MPAKFSHKMKTLMVFQSIYKVRMYITACVILAIACRIITSVTVSQWDQQDHEFFSAVP